MRMAFKRNARLFAPPLMLALALGLAGPACAEGPANPRPATLQPANPLIDYHGFAALTAEIAPYRAQRLLSLGDFSKRRGDRHVLLLDARSASAYKAGHIKGAVNLPFTDFTAASLAEVIGKDPNRPILIYCNNNFRNNVKPVVTKALPLALNIPTFINLVGYGYANIWELGEAVDMNDPVIEWQRG
ncbi:MAG: rhodanese-like domain-containing protein [Sphingomonas bacterium]